MPKFDTSSYWVESPNPAYLYEIQMRVILNMIIILFLSFWSTNFSSLPHTILNWNEGGFDISAGYIYHQRGWGVFEYYWNNFYDYNTVEYNNTKSKFILVISRDKGCLKSKKEKNISDLIWYRLCPLLCNLFSMFCVISLEQKASSGIWSGLSISRLNLLSIGVTRDLFISLTVYNGQILYQIASSLSLSLSLTHTHTHTHSLHSLKLIHHKVAYY